MKNFYIECEVSYTDNSDGDSYDSKEYYSFTMECENLSLARYRAKIKALNNFNEDLNDGFENITVDVVWCYETSGDARSS